MVIVHLNQSECWYYICCIVKLQRNGYILKYIDCSYQIPVAPLTNFNDGGGGIRQRFTFYTQKNHNSEFVYPKKSLLFIAYPKKSLCFSSRPKKILASFIDPKKSLLAKVSDPKKSLGPPLSLKYVSGAPGYQTVLFFGFGLIRHHNCHWHLFCTI